MTDRHADVERLLRSGPQSLFGLSEAEHRVVVAHVLECASCAREAEVCTTLIEYWAGELAAVAGGDCKTRAAQSNSGSRRSAAALVALAVLVGVAMLAVVYMGQGDSRPSSGREVVLVGHSQGGLVKSIHADHAHGDMYLHLSQRDSDCTINAAGNLGDSTGLTGCPPAVLDSTPLTFGDSGTATTTTRSTYRAGSGLTLTGSTFSRNPVAFSELTIIPAGLLDGDNDTTYSAGTGLTLTGTTFSIDFTPADARYLRLSGGSLTGAVTSNLASGTALTLSTTNTGGSALSVTNNGTFGGSADGIDAYTFSSGGAAIVGWSKTTATTNSNYGVWGRADSATGVAVQGVTTPTPGATAVRGDASSQSGTGVVGNGATGGSFQSTTTGGMAVFAQGDNAIWANGTSGGIAVRGRATGTTAIGVYGETVGSSGIAVQAVTSAGGGNAIVANLSTGITNSTTTTDNLFIGQNLGTNVARVDRTGRGFFNGGTQTNGADVAESMPADSAFRPLEPGDVLVVSRVNDGHVALSCESESTTVLGVYSTRPGVILTLHDVAGESVPAGEVPCGIKGRIPTKVCDEGGAIHRGDLLVTASRAGYAKRASANPKPGSIVGKALAELESGEALILVMVSVQ